MPDWDEPDFAPRGNARPAPRPAASPARASGSSSRPYIEAGQEIEGIRKELENRKQHLLVTALEDAQIHYETGLLQVTMANDDAWAKRLRDATATFRDIGTMLFGQPLRLEVVINSNVTSLINEAAQERAAAHEKAKQNPAVKMVLDKFKGEIVSVRSQAAQAQ